MLFYLVSWIVNLIFQAYILLLFGRAIISWIEVLSPGSLPNNRFMFLLINLVYRLTDPPLQLLGRYVPPVRLGNFSLDLSFIVLFLLVLVMQRFANFLLVFLLVDPYIRGL